MLKQPRELFLGSSTAAASRRMKRQRIGSGWRGCANLIMVTREQLAAAVMLMQQVKFIGLFHFTSFDPVHSFPLYPLK